MPILIIKRSDFANYEVWEGIVDLLQNGDSKLPPVCDIEEIEISAKLTEIDGVKV